MKQESSTALTRMELPGDRDSSRWTSTTLADRPNRESSETAEDSCCSGTRLGSMPALLTTEIAGSCVRLGRSRGSTPWHGSMCTTALPPPLG